MQPKEWIPPFQICDAPPWHCARALLWLSEVGPSNLSATFSWSGRRCQNIAFSDVIFALCSLFLYSSCLILSEVSYTTARLSYHELLKPIEDPTVTVSILLP